ncbi:hypothetical protein PRIPAC_91218 [Pristionchus pacificus]|uniref:Uncharacterized protein n=1 Tax=Pristionchus pacificus TaxID=54126 RepID=A0A454XU62_PRIPA|nr:hypothetical protein PRIPAC_91218 [Pristionchus pacificus]|eukprot:PDM82255.1 hypothetical protein PRIPAC_36648 [Pristionchus pacificus]
MNFIYCSILLIATSAAVVDSQKIQKLKFMCDDALSQVSDLGNGAGEQVLKTYEDCKNAIWTAYQKVVKGETKADKVKRIAKEYGESAKDIIAAFRP